jgi:hypothetical protein
VALCVVCVRDMAALEVFEGSAEEGGRQSARECNSVAPTYTATATGMTRTRRPVIQEASVTRC